jgi:alpha-ketoglutarate-dependent sulfate ester dioxygenase
MSNSPSAPNYSRAADAALDIRPITPAIGTEIRGVRLSGDLPAATVTAIRDALMRHRVVFFRGQGHLDEAGHQAFARLLGPLVPHPTLPSVAGTEAVLDIDGENGRASQWHTDMTFVPAFPLFSVLRGVVIPPVGGDTVRASRVARSSEARTQELRRLCPLFAERAQEGGKQTGSVGGGNVPRCE